MWNDGGDDDANEANDDSDNRRQLVVWEKGQMHSTHWSIDRIQTAFLSAERVT